MFERYSLAVKFTSLCTWLGRACASGQRRCSSHRCKGIGARGAGVNQNGRAKGVSRPSGTTIPKRII